ncbi:MAG: Rrf2 family transcriptional regulator [Candidatus Nanopelagicales bacterium]
MQISARVDYALRAMSELALSWDTDPQRLQKADALAARQQIPARFLEGILGQLRKAGLVISQRGADGGYRLAIPPDDICVADIIRVLDGPLGAVRNEAPEDAVYTGPAEHLRAVWVATRAALRSVLENTTLEDVVTGHRSDAMATLLNTPGAWDRR